MANKRNTFFFFFNLKQHISSVAIRIANTTTTSSLITAWSHETQIHQTTAAPWQQSVLQLISEYFSTKGRLQVCMRLITDLLEAVRRSMFGQPFVNYSSTSRAASQRRARQKQSGDERVQTFFSGTLDAKAWVSPPLWSWLHFTNVF